jgi:hypothetical protein
MVPSTLYARVRLVTGGTFTAGIGADWSTQFDDSAITTSFQPIIGGEINVGKVTTGVCADIALYTANPFDVSLWIEAAAAAGTVQLYVNGAITELTAAALNTVSLIRGFNVLKLSCASGPLMLFGRFLSELGLARWQSLYAIGSDPIVASSGGGAGGASAGGLGGGPH